MPWWYNHEDWIKAFFKNFVRNLEFKLFTINRDFSLFLLLNFSHKNWNDWVYKFLIFTDAFLASSNSHHSVSCSFIKLKDSINRANFLDLSKSWNDLENLRELNIREEFKLFLSEEVNDSFDNLRVELFMLDA